MKQSEYEKQQYDLITEWENKEPSVVSKLVSTILSPVSNLISIVVPEKAIEGAIDAANATAQYLTDTADVLRDGKVESIAELRTKDLKLSDQIADTVHNWAIGIAVTEGAATGSIGLPGMAVDIPFVITLALRTIHKIGVCYGFNADASNAEEEKAFALGVLSAASASTLTEKTGFILGLKQISLLIQKNAWKKLAEMSSANLLAKGVINIKQAAKIIGVNLTKRKASQAIPVIGAGVGASMNASFINDIAWAARRSFQRRWLEENKVIESEASLD
ncbi:MAG: EcsC family protein [Prevotella histicola]|uniref:EcsC family protein n=1 Tax=Prevotella histicola TaxID=470565 RepID=UPI001CB3C608|nr:EcsC family protein [Prevotella histicola]MBF1426183.1 EcsC family protein [Prevotella histicola]